MRQDDQTALGFEIGIYVHWQHTSGPSQVLGFQLPNSVIDHENLNPNQNEHGVLIKLVRDHELISDFAVPHLSLDQELLYLFL
jgi:hypothetical protein